jgi:DNA processing protein
VPKLENSKERLRELSIIACLDNIRGIGPIKFRQIYETYKSFSSFWEIVTTTNELQLEKDETLKGSLDKKFLTQIKEYAEYLDSSKEFMEQQLERAKSLGGKLVTYIDCEYPRNLYLTNQCVPILYALGNVDILREWNCCAVVGTRNPSEWSINQTKEAIQNLVKQSTVVVSGLAKGIDAIAHDTTLIQRGKTIAVLGCGTDICYPQENRPLYERIRQKGVVISEYPFGTRISPVSLQKRDKIIVGLSKNVLVAQTSKEGGTMNAYRAAVEQKKAVGIFLPPFGIAGNFDGNKLIMQEKKIKVHCFQDGKSVFFEENGQ